MSEPTTKPLLRLKELTVSFDGNVVVDALSLTVNAGETLAIVGSALAGRDRPDAAKQARLERHSWQSCWVHFSGADDLAEPAAPHWQTD